jgi:simple sugar transport system ATP-binding protein
VLFASPHEAQRGGVSAVYQEVNLCPNLSVAENIYIGREPRRAGRIQWRAMRRHATDALARVDVHVDVSALLSTNSLAVQQMVAIARAIDISADVLILDEPTSSLDKGEVDRLFDVIRQLASQGIAVVFVSHFLDQVYEISDRITVLRNGRLVGEWPTGELTRVELVSKMLGREYKTLEALERRTSEAVDALEASTPVLEAKAVGRKKAIAPFDLALRPGEVVGLAGLLGSGRTEIARLLFGADRADSGRVLIDGKPVTIRSPRVATANGVAFCSENRRTEGVVEDLTVRENILLALQAARGWTRPIPRKRQEELADHWIRALDIRVASAEQPMRSLSGGNQQKVLLARWLLTQPRLLILDEPTRGIDVGAKTEIQRLVISLCDDGMSVLFISTELEEVLRLSHKVEVLRDRKLVAELVNDEHVTLDALVETIAGGAAA